MPNIMMTREAYLFIHLESPRLNVMPHLIRENTLDDVIDVVNLLNFGHKSRPMVLHMNHATIFVLIYSKK